MASSHAGWEGGPVRSEGPSQEPAGSVAQARLLWGRKVGGLRGPGSALQLSGGGGVGDRGLGLGSTILEAERWGESGAGGKLEGSVPPKTLRGTFSPPVQLESPVSLGLKQRPPPPWASVGGLAVGLACLFMLFSLEGRLEALREELTFLRRGSACQPTRTAAAQGSPRPPQRADGGLLPHRLKGRWKRDLERVSQEHLRHHRKQSVLHLVPARHSNNEEEGATEIWWAPFLQQGRALEPRGQEVVVKHTGLYLVYSQVLFHDPTFTMGQVLQRAAQGQPDQILFRCIQSMPQNPYKAYNSCYSGGVFHLQKGDRLSLRIPRFNASFDVSTHGTFLGVLRL